MAVVYTYENKLLIDDWDPCEGHKTSYAMTPVSAIDETVAETVSRPKPEAPLWGSPTSHGPHWTTDYLLCEARKGGYYEKDCNGYGPYQGYRTVYSYHFPYFFPSDVPITNWQLDLRLKILDQKVNIGADLAEFKETAGMFRGFARTAHNAYRDFRKLRKGRPPLTSCDVAASELIAAYGLEPLMGTLYDSVGKLQETIASKQVRRFIVTKKVEERIDEYLRDSQFTGYQTVSNRAIAYVEFDSATIADEFSLGNPASIAWELTPFSFVADWALPVGDWLEALTVFDDSVRLSSCTVTTKHAFDVKVEHDHGDDYVEYSPGHVGYESWSRVVTGVPLPSFPSFENPLSLKRLANASALLHQIKNCPPPRRKRRKRRPRR